MTTLLALDIDGVIRDVKLSYLKALADTVEHYTEGQYRPNLEDIDALKSEGIWNNDWEGSQELSYRFYEQQGKSRDQMPINYAQLVDFFQERYLGRNFDGYIQDESLLVDRDFFGYWDELGVPWGFVSGASRTSAEFVLCNRLQLIKPPLVAMGEAAEKPDPAGLLKLITYFAQPIHNVVYCGDTVADILTVINAAKLDPNRTYTAIGILPPHNPSDSYRQQLLQAGAHHVLYSLKDLNVEHLPLARGQGSGH
jgi:HAD superfamily phosphatase